MPISTLLLAAALAAGAPAKHAPAAAPASVAGDTAALFPQLERLHLPREGVRIFYPKGRATPVTAPAAYLASYAEAGVAAEQPLRFDLGHGVPPVTLTCDAGPHGDPSCRLLADANDPGTTLFEAAGVDFVLQDNADIYVFGRSDAHYDARRLFRFDGKRYVEAAQAFRYVGIDGTATAPFALTHERNGDAAQALAQVPSGARVSVLLNAVGSDADDGGSPDYLVKTREGLVGWAHLPSGSDGRTAIDTLYFGSANASR